ncbi:MAG: zeta toxin family protein [Campylobacteraceae bacterium]|jgi:predicted ABC-type ATPase|nr:zeta toxin family protein [Campylobacteraceae bacterium]
MSNLIIISGTNGVGKSTFGGYLKMRNDILFINTDEFFKNMFGGFYQYSNEELKAGTMAIHNLQNRYFSKRRIFAVERILSGEKEINNLIDRAKSHSYKISLVYIGINTLELSIKRVKQRFKEGGHNVENDIIKENLDLGIKNFQTICPKVDNVILYDNTKADSGRYKKLLDMRDKKICFQTQELPKWSRHLVEAVHTKITTAAIETM